MRVAHVSSSPSENVANGCETSCLNGCKCECFAFVGDREASRKHHEKTGPKTGPAFTCTPEMKKRGTLNPATQCAIGLLASSLARTQGIEATVKRECKTERGTCLTPFAHAPPTGLLLNFVSQLRNSTRTSWTEHTRFLEEEARESSTTWSLGDCL